MMQCLQKLRPCSPLLQACLGLSSSVLSSLSPGEHLRPAQSFAIGVSDPEPSTSYGPLCGSVTSTWHHQYRGFATQGKSLSRAELVKRALNQPVSTLHHDRPRDALPANFNTTFGQTMLKVLGYYSKKNQIIHAGQRLYNAVSEQTDTGALQKAFGTGKVFWSTYTFLSLHVWMVIYRLGRSSHQDVKVFRQRFYMQFQRDVEHRIYSAGLQVGVTKWLNKLEEHFYSTGYAMDDAMAGKGEAKLVDVILNKYYGGDAKSLPDAELLTAYIIRELNCLMATDEKHVLSGDIKFSEALQRLALPQEAPTAAEAATEKDGSAADLMGPAGIETLAAAVPAK